MAKAKQAAAASAPVYGIGLIGAVVYYMQIAHSFGDVILGLLKAIVWPAFLVHGLLRLVG